MITWNLYQLTQKGKETLPLSNVSKTLRQGILTDLKARGLKDIPIACIDNLKGFAEDIETVFPQDVIQN